MHLVTATNRSFAAVFLYRICWQTILFCLPAVALPAGLPPYSEAALQAWWKSRPDDADFHGESEKLKNQLLASQNEPGTDLPQLFSQTNFLGWLELACWLDNYPAASSTEYLSSKEGRAEFVRIGTNTALRSLFLANLSPRDNGPNACRILCQIAQAEPAGLKQLPQLAIAMALVFDQPFPEKWPHLWVRKEDLPVGDSDPVKRFRALWKISRGVEIPDGSTRKFLIDPSRLTVRDLMFVVDTPVDFKEINYVLQVKLGDPARLNDLFPQVPYDKSRMNRNDLIWPGGAYRLIDIGKKGGICADQAYFVAMAGKAQGIPTVLFMGQGASGGHAWVGYQGAPGRWSMNVARYRQENFTSGATWDPQTWRRITDAQLIFICREPATGTALLHGHLLARWAIMNRSEDSYPQLLGIARSAWPHSIDIWELQAECLEDHHLPAEDRRAFWENWISTFKDDRDMRFKGQSALLRLYEANQNQPVAAALKAQMIAENKHARFDLAASLAAAPVLDLANAGKWPEATSAFEKLLADCRGRADGNLFYNLVQPFIEQAVQAGEINKAREALSQSRPLFKVPPLSTLAVDFKVLETSVSGK